MEGESWRGFAWWGPHDRARREAVFLLALVATICAAYLAIVIISVVVAMRVGELGPWRTLATWQHDLGPIGLAGVAVLVVIGAAAIIAFLAREGLARRAIRLARARLPASDEADRAQPTIEAFAIGVGMPTPRFCIVDADAPNGFGTGRPRARCGRPLRRRPQAGGPAGETPIAISNQEGALSGISKRGWRISSTWMLSGSLK